MQRDERERDPAGAAGHTATGPVRADNEDHWHVDARLGLFVVADGMGGHQAGEVASRLAVAEVVAEVAAARRAAGAGDGRDAAAEARAVVMEALGRADHAVFAAGAADPSLVGMGTTLTVLLLDGGHAVVGSVGDSRAYLVRGEEIRQLTHDDTWLASVFGQAGASEAAAQSHPMRHVLTRVIGARDVSLPEVLAVATEPGDVFVLATDGLHNVVDDASIGRMARNAPAEAAARQLVEDALARGTTDNVTVVVVRPA